MNLRKYVDFDDVTLACEDGQQVGAHKVILATSSPFFQSPLKRNKHAHPLIYMRGVKFENLLSIVDFIYLGETKIYQEQLDSFLGIAEELQLKGLMPQNKIFNGEVLESATVDPKQVLTTKANNSKSQELVKFEEHTPRKENSDETIALTSKICENLQELDEKVKSLMGRTKNYKTEGWKKGHMCIVCGKEGQSIHVQRHIETVHLEGFPNPCNQCDKICMNREALRSHKRRVHGKGVLSV